MTHTSSWTRGTTSPPLLVRGILSSRAQWQPEALVADAARLDPRGIANTVPYTATDFLERTGALGAEVCR